MPAVALRSCVIRDQWLESLNGTGDSRYTPKCDARLQEAHPTCFAEIRLRFHC